MAFSTAELRTDGFLGNRLQILQPRHGFRSGADAVMLAAACAVKPGDAVLEIGCGTGVVALCLGARVPGLRLTGLELQPDYADLARRNATANGIALAVVDGDLAAMPASLRAMRFSHVIMNPPYFQADGPMDDGRGIARHEVTPLQDWLATGLRRLSPGGTITLIHKPDRLPTILACLGRQAGDVRILPLVSRAGRAAGRVIVAARKGARGPLALLAPFVLHAAPHHQADGQDLSSAAQAVLREGAAISLKDRISA